MNSIMKETTSVLEIQKSKFITKLYPVFEQKEIIQLLRQIRREYRNATHYCYGYILSSEKKCSDDGEPSKTAGAPILHVLEQQKLNYVLAVVVRYYGGIPLGVGGLVRAYTNAVTNALKISEFGTISKGNQYEISFTYEDKKTIDYLLKDCKILEPSYLDEVTYLIEVNTAIFHQIEKELLSLTKTMKLMKEILIINKKDKSIE